MQSISSYKLYETVPPIRPQIVNINSDGPLNNNVSYIWHDV